MEEGIDRSGREWLLTAPPTARGSALLPSGLLQTIARRIVLAFGSHFCWHPLVWGRPRFSYKGLTAHKLTPMPGVHNGMQPTSYLGG